MTTACIRERKQPRSSLIKKTFWTSTVPGACMWTPGAPFFFAVSIFYMLIIFHHRFAHQFAYAFASCDKNVDDQQSNRMIDESEIVIVCLSLRLCLLPLCRARLWASHPAIPYHHSNHPGYTLLYCECDFLHKQDKFQKKKKIKTQFTYYWRCCSTYFI